jgi:hypothetical protein
MVQEKLNTPYTTSPIKLVEGHAGGVRQEQPGDGSTKQAKGRC